MRTLIALLITTCSVSPCAFAQSPLTKILLDELTRNFTLLKQQADPPPYFMGYAVTETESDGVEASSGSVDDESHSHTRDLDVTVRTGDSNFDNYRRVGNDQPRLSTSALVALDDNPAAIKRVVWLNTDKAYRSASRRLTQLKSDDKLRAAPQDASGDFSSAPPQVSFSAAPKLKFNQAEWEGRLRKLSAEFNKYPGALNANVTVETQRVSKTLVTTEGTQIEQGRLFSRLTITANGKAADGMDLSTLDTFEAEDPAKLPKDTEILAAVQKSGALLQDLLKAQPADPFVGPAILSGRAAGVFFHEIFGHRVEGHRQKDENEGQTFTKSVNMPVLPDFLSVIFDPTVKEFEGKPLNGTYEFDDEGVKAQRLTLVDKGILKTFLMSRSPIDGFPQSNGHGRRQPGYEIVSRQSNLFVESTNKVSDAELHKMLIEEIKRQGKPYGLYFDQVTSGYTTTQRAGLQAFTVKPLTVYKVYPDGASGRADSRRGYRRNAAGKLRQEIIATSGQKRRVQRLLRR